MNIEAVTVCVDYGDFLKEIAPLNSPLFDRWIIVTKASDEETRSLCAKFGLTCLVSEDHRLPGGSVGKFNKGAMIDRGLQLCSRGAWRLHLDADIVLPAQFRHFLRIAQLQPENLYGVDRVNVNGWDQWRKLLASGWLHHASSPYLNCIDLPQGVPVGARWCSWRTGYVPLGYFQLWHSSEDEHGWAMTKTYPINSGDACHSDTQHAFQWDRRRRVFIPEIVAVHLESERVHTGANWNGRKTRRFEPPKKNQAQASFRNHDHPYPPPCPPKTWKGIILADIGIVRLLIVEGHGFIQGFKVPENCPITHDGRPVKLRNLRRGMHVTVVAEGTEADSVSATGRGWAEGQ